MIICFSIPAFAAEVPAENYTVMASENTISPLSNSYSPAGVAVTSSAWTTIATSTTGFNCNVKISALNGGLPATTSIRMLGKDGSVVWEEHQAISFSSSRIFWCGSDVYKIQARFTNGVGTVSCWASN